MPSPSVAVLAAAGRQYSRQPINIILFLVLPPLFVLALGAAMSTFSDVLGGNLTKRTSTALAAVWAAALLAGSATFFVVGGSRRADERLIISGLRRRSLQLAHAAGAAAVSVAAGTTGFLLVIATTEIASPIHLLAAVLLGSLAYAFVGMGLASVVTGDLEGSFLIVFLFMFDAFIAGPLGGAAGFWPNLFPLHHPSQMAVDAALHTNIDAGRYAWSVGYLILLLGVSGLAQRRRSV